MAQFIVRVELHQATYADYERLHGQMEGRGFSRTIPASDGKRYNLPTAEYYRDAAATCEQILEQAKASAAYTGKAYAVLVSELNTWISNGLTVASS